MVGNSLSEWDPLEFWNKTHDDYIELNKASIRIKLRLNQTECDSKLILKSMRDMEALFAAASNELPNVSVDKLNRIVESLEQDAPPLLKKEWERVKKGEQYTFWHGRLLSVCCYLR